MNISVKEIIGVNCVTPEDGDKLYQLIKPKLIKQELVTVDFENVSVFASPFFNMSIGRLLSDIKPEDLNQFLQIKGLDPDDMMVLRRVIENSKKYYLSNKPEQEKYNKLVQQQLEEDDD